VALLVRRWRNPYGVGRRRLRLRRPVSHCALVRDIRDERSPDTPLFHVAAPPDNECDPMCCFDLKPESIIHAAVATYAFPFSATICGRRVALTRATSRFSERR
jgi:hypothetical protein